jgi:hypothetical protein
MVCWFILTIRQVNSVRTTLPDEKHSNQGSSNPSKDGYGDQALQGRVGSQENRILSDGEKNRTSSTSKDGGNDPS